MAVGKEAPISNLAIAGIARREALEAVVAEFTETFSSLSTTTIKRRLKDAVLTMPNSHETDEIECKNAAAAAASSEESL